MPAPVRTVFCPANTWTTVEWTVNLPFLTRRWTAPGGTTIRWRWFSSGPPFYWEGTFVGSGCITFGPGFYTNLQFNPGPASVTVTWGGC
jgi:hypothetical protein